MRFLSILAAVTGLTLGVIDTGNAQVSGSQGQHQKKDNAVDGKVVVLKNNGLTSFVPPCFSWEVLADGTYKKIVTASEVDLSKLKLSREKERETLDSLYKGELRVKGHTTKVRAEKPTGQEGLRFTIDEVVGPVKAGK